MNTIFRKAQLNDLLPIWKILQDGILRRKADGSQQWQDGYPNVSVVENDIENGYGFVLEIDGKIAGYCAILINDEPVYQAIEGKWLSEGNFVVYHRVAVSEDFLGQGIAKKMLQEIETFALQHNIYSLKADTNYDNPAMMGLFERLGYQYCGEVYFRGSARRAYEKVLQ
ncbi:GNAT family N-acetyltransferase [Flavobacterium sp. NST-5]|uniref:GNAT family N-acetyltransferase n=1 Tax=Flavobacterium ichthyis TaxID=2698827 RepID=A0ABW9ZDB5_9FLAO|nr:GNAT family N-acetyltransferase [Flavobacterium ichthyis]NBL66101.1 GNAT family N-acetyltransferase [Flavobacterium ichthyis]